MTDMHDTHSMQQRVPNVHDLYMKDRQCGRSLHTWRAARMLRGISACAAVLSTEREETLELGAMLRGGLIEAIDELAFQVDCELEGLDERINRAQGGAV